MPKDHWKSFLPKMSPPNNASYSSWLRDNGSLTKRIQQRCHTFSVQQINSGLMQAVRDETTLLSLARQQNIYTREVYLFADGKPVVFAHSVVATQHLRGAWHTIKNLGTRPLGALLFSHPLVHRAPLHYQALKSSHVLYRRAAAKLNTAPTKLWARRSIFTLHGAPLLVTEIFLPDILALSK